MRVINFLYLSLFWDIWEKLPKMTKNGHFEHFFAHNFWTKNPIVPIFELSLTNSIPRILKKIWAKSVEIYSSYRSDRQTDRQTFFLLLIPYLYSTTKRFPLLRESNSQCYKRRPKHNRPVLLRTGLKSFYEFSSIHHIFRYIWENSNIFI
jgi:hypothetical protein